MSRPAGTAWSTTTGVGAVVAVVDTGIDFAQPDLQGQILPGATFTVVRRSLRAATATFAGPDGVNNGDEHGTHVAGTIGAVRGNGIGVVGVAPGAKILPVKVLEAGSGFTAGTPSCRTSWTRSRSRLREVPA